MKNGELFKGNNLVQLWPVQKSQPEFRWNKEDADLLQTNELSTKQWCSCSREPDSAETGRRHALFGKRGSGVDTGADHPRMVFQARCALKVLIGCPLTAPTPCCISQLRCVFPVIYTRESKCRSATSATEQHSGNDILCLRGILLEQLPLNKAQESHPLADTNLREAFATRQ